MSSNYGRPGVQQPLAKRTPSLPTTAPAGPRKPAPPSRAVSVATAPIDPMLTTYQVRDSSRLTRDNEGVETAA